MRALFTTRSQGTLANAAWENQKRPSARSVSPARVVQIERTTLEPFRPSTEGCARRHIRDLQLQNRGRSAAEQNELDNLKTLYPDLPLDPDDPLTEAFEAWRRERARLQHRV